MDNHPTSSHLLDLISAPCFCVSDGRILACNAGAKGLLLQPGMSIEGLLHTGREEYAAFSSGSLYLTLNLEGSIFGATVERKDQADYFLMDEPAQTGELRALALAARDLRAPMAGILATAEELSLQAKDSESARHQLGLMNRSLAQMLRIIGNMSDACRVPPASRQETTDVCALFSEMFEKTSVLAETANVTIRYQGPEQPVFCLADREQLERAVLNLISNALKFAPAGGALDASLTKSGKMLRFSIRDNGPGFAQNLLGNAFNRYLRQPCIEDGRNGLGLGMVLVRTAAASHGGAVLIDQPEGGGARVTMTMEIRQNAPGTLRSPVMRVDYAGEQDHALVELADCLPAELYKKET